MTLLTAALLTYTSAPAFAKTRFATIGTGGITGVYYPAGGAIARILNRKRKVYGIRATVESTAGSVFNVNALMSGDLDFGIVQSDRQYQAWHGLADWKKKGSQKDLRAVFSIHSESVILVAADNSEIAVFADLKGKKVNIGNPGSGQRGNALDALKAGGLDWKKDIRAQGIKASESAKMLQDGRIDAFFYTVGHPSGSIQEATSGRRKVHFVPIPFVDELTARYPYYVKSVIPVSLYPMASNKKDVPTFGMKATFLTSKNVPDEVVYALTKELFENLKEFKKMHPAFARLSSEGMLEGNTAPYHPGALKYFKEAGLSPSSASASEPEKDSSESKP